VKAAASLSHTLNNVLTDAHPPIAIVQETSRNIQRHATAKVQVDQLNVVDVQVAFWTKDNVHKVV
jgi:hypothetical protein